MGLDLMLAESGYSDNLLIIPDRTAMVILGLFQEREYFQKKNRDTLAGCPCLSSIVLRHLLSLSRFSLILSFISRHQVRLMRLVTVHAPNQRKAGNREQYDK
jgi:hypothetical protein